MVIHGGSAGFLVELNFSGLDLLKSSKTKPYSMYHFLQMGGAALNSGIF